MPTTVHAAIRHTVRGVLILFLVLSITACSGGSGNSTPNPTPSLVSISVTPASPSVAAGLTEQFTASGLYSDASKADITRSVSWTSGTGSVAKINASGLATSLAQGTSVITATSGSVSGSDIFTVTAPQVVSLAVFPATATMQLGATAPHFTAIATYTDKSTQDVSSTAAWTVSNPWIATIDSTGTVTANRTGYTAVNAVSGTFSATANFTVLSTPRYLYVSSDAARDLTRMTVNASTGQPRFTGYQKTGSNFSIPNECLTIDPAGQHAYLASQGTVSGGSTYEGLVDIYNIDASSGVLTPYAGNPLTFSSPIGCLHFEASGRFAYATTGIENAGNELVSFSVNSDATLSQVSTISLPSAPDGLAIDPLGQFLYVAAEDTGNGSAFAYGYAIDPSTGGLTPIPGTPFPLPAGTYGFFSFHPSGNYVYRSDSSGTSISEYTIDRTSGLISSAASAALNPCINPSVLQFSPDGAYAYLSCREDSSRSSVDAPLISMSVGSGGQLTQISSAPAGINPGQMLVDPSSKFIYLLSSGNDYVSSSPGSYTVANNCVMVYQVGADGRATLVNQIAGRVMVHGLMLVGGTNPVVWSPAHAYVASAGDNKLTSYTVQADGSLNPLQSLNTTATPAAATMLPWGSDLLLSSPVAAPNLTGYAVSNGVPTQGWSFGQAAQPGGLVIDPSGKLAFNPDSSTGLVYEYASIGTPGYWSSVFSTTPSTPLTYAAQAGAGPVITDPAGRFLIVANQAAKSISAFEYAGAAPISPVSLTYTPLAIAMDPTGNWLFVAGDDQKLHLLVSNGLGQFTDSASALLAGNSPSIAIDPGAHFVYAAGSAGLSAFSINAQTLALTPISLNPPVPLANATGVYIDPSGQFLYVPVSSNTLNALYRFNINTDGTLSSPGTPLVASPSDATAIVFDGQFQ